MSEERATAAIPLDMMEGIQNHLDKEEETKASLDKRLTDVEAVVKALDRGQLGIFRRLDDQDILLSNQAAAAKKSAEVAEANNVILTQIRDLFAAGRVGTNLLAWLGKAWPGLVVIGLGLRELYRTKTGH